MIFFYQPIPRHAICNVGDALALFSGGILRSNLHRVLYDFLCWPFQPSFTSHFSGHHLHPKLELSVILWSTSLDLATQSSYVHSSTKAY